ncbi:hypothetical protein [uncultured Paenibacillus sp.]|uniref:hypothetical protein n=1 Tax=uncultured Paenibacillus sp. TaxID=227322 RepID=UPI0015B2FE96|nr:hypothetical protein [uncultured Paenibacillus sp.]
MRITPMSQNLRNPNALHQVVSMLNERAQQKDRGVEQELQKLALLKTAKADQRQSGPAEVTISVGASNLNRAISTYDSFLDGLEPVEKYIAVLDKREQALQTARNNPQASAEELETLEQNVSLVKSRIQDQVNLITDFYGKFYISSSRLNQQAPLLPPGHGSLSAQDWGWSNLSEKSAAEIGELYLRTVTELSDYKAQLEQKAGIVPNPRNNPVDRSSQEWQDEIAQLDRSLLPISKVFDSFEVDYSQHIDIRF